MFSSGIEGEDLIKMNNMHSQLNAVVCLEKTSPCVKRPPIGRSAKIVHDFL